MAPQPGLTVYPDNFSEDQTVVKVDPSMSSEAFSTESDDRDEVQEVRKVARNDTFKVVVWRFIVTTVLLLTAVAVTLTTYFFLERQQTDSFEELFEQFSRTVGDSAYDQQKRLRIGYQGFADTITAVSQGLPGVEWPFFRMENFESYAKNMLEASSMEVITMFHVVQHDQRDEWVQFSNQTYQHMVEEGHMLKFGNLDNLNPVGYHDYVTAVSTEGNFSLESEQDYYLTMLDFSPPPTTYGMINWNVRTDTTMHGPLLKSFLELKNETLISKVQCYPERSSAFLSPLDHADMHKNVFLENSDVMNPHAYVWAPVYERVNDPTSRMVSVIAGVFAWDVFMIGLLPEGVNGITVILENSCGQVYTYKIDGPKVRFLGPTDLHETKYDHLEAYQDLAEGFYFNPRQEEMPDHCRYNLRIYPSSVFEDALNPFVPEIFAIVVATSFVLVVVVFFVYDLFVQQRNEKLVANAAQSNAIVSSMFPSNIRDRLINTDQSLYKKHGSNLKSFMAGNSADADAKKPLADLFLDCTVLFADISGFTAWSSVREPSQVFTILETVYGAFDKIAKYRRVFKVETVGDCYVAATGIPDFRKDHAVVMIRFARDILAKMSVLTKELETTLGPDTSDLGLRIGVHSGPVTAGVLRGERARFQLFGDTMNVCSRIESTGMAGRIHLSSETSENLTKNGKDHWVIKREDRVEAKGKGDMQTYWVGAAVEKDSRAGSVAGSSCAGEHVQEHSNAVFEPMDHDRTEAGHGAKMARLVDWNVEMLSCILVQIVARQKAKMASNEKTSTVELRNGKHHPRTSEEVFIPLDDVKEIIELPEFDAKAASRQDNTDTIVLPPNVIDQLRRYITTIAGMYRDNSFHNFDHASHVTMSVIKLLSRIVAPPELFEEDEEGGVLYSTLHDHTYGITGDPLTQFSCALAALIHDVDHVGVTNSQLVKEGARIAHIYSNRSVAEQNSLVLAWDLFMMDEFDELRSTLCSNEAELERFRQLVVNAVMATDIFDKDLKALRNARWEKAFKDTEVQEDERTAVNRKATIVIEHLIQASDVAHTMQHWHVYRKWNEKFFRECYAAFVAGRAEKDPTGGWYKGELGFFDFYIIPLAKKLKECGVFGKSSDEYLTYALANRREWENRGEEVVAEMIGAIKRENRQRRKMRML